MSWERVDLSLEQYNRPTEPPITCGLIYGGGKRHAISGPPEAAKTVVALICGLEHSRAGHGRFALIDFEMGEHATRLLLHELGATLEEIANVIYYAPEGPPDEADIDTMTGFGVTLAVIDAAAGAYDASGLDDMKRKDAEEWARTWVKPLWKRGVSTLLLDHVVKRSNQRGKFSIGTERKLGAVDVHLGLEAVKQLHRGADGLITITTHKDRPAHLARPRAATLELHSDPDTHRITWAFVEPKLEQVGETWRPTVLMEKVSRFLERQTEAVSRSSIAKPESVRGKREFVLIAVDCLVSEGYAGATDGTRISSIQPFRDVPDVPAAESEEAFQQEPHGKGVPDVPDTFPGVPGTPRAPDVPTFPPPTRGNGNGNDHDDAEVERLMAKYGNAEKS